MTKRWRKPYHWKTNFSVHHRRLTFIMAASSGPERGGGGMRGFLAASSKMATSSSLSGLLPLPPVEGPLEGTDIYIYSILKLTVTF